MLTRSPDDPNRLECEGCAYWKHGDPITHPGKIQAPKKLECETCSTWLHRTSGGTGLDHVIIQEPTIDLEIPRVSQWDSSYWMTVTLPNECLKERNILNMSKNDSVFFSLPDSSPR